MSFQDVGPRRPTSTPPRRSTRLQQDRLRLRKFRTTSSTSSVLTSSSGERRTTPVVLHRRAVEYGDTAASSSSSSSSSAPDLVSTAGESSSLEMDADTIQQQRRRENRKSRFSQLTSEITMFHKMVQDLEVLLDRGRESPEVQWRARIVLRSAQETDQDLWNKLYEYERTLLVLSPSAAPYDVQLQVKMRAEKTACMKLHRDFKRIHKSLIMIINKYEQRQHADIASLMENPIGWSGGLVHMEGDGNYRYPRHRQESKDEDYFERQMRARDLEVRNIKKKMNKVNDIYKELAGMVNGQQDQVDVMESQINYSRANTEAGAERLKKGMAGTCGRAISGCIQPDAEEEKAQKAKPSGEEAWYMPFENFQTELQRALDFSEEENRSPPRLRVEEDFQWYMPFETIHDDMRSVRKDIVGLGKDIVSTGLFQCSAPAPVSPTRGTGQTNNFTKGAVL